jgi:hypothetical protein
VILPSLVSEELQLEGLEEGKYAIDLEEVLRGLKLSNLLQNRLGGIGGDFVYF